ncbi:phage protein Gp37 [Ectopseudomonas mendocina]|nr:phage protein Gp37 [Pseudomonas mendocina]
MLSAIEDAIAERCHKVAGAYVSTIQELPGAWDDSSLAEILSDLPGIYINWSGGAAAAGSRALLDSQYGVYIVTGQNSNERVRRRGDASMVGAYQLLERVVPGLHGLSIEGIGTLQLERLENLYSAQAEQHGVAIYGAFFVLNKLLFPAALSSAGLADFTHYHSNSKVPDGPDSETHLTLPAGSEVQP